MNLSFPGQTYSSSNKPSTATLKQDLQTIQTDFNALPDPTVASTFAVNRPKVTASIDDSAGNEVIKTPATASAVNEVTVTNAATGGTPDISASGGDTDISVSLQGKGTGKVEVELPFGSATVTSTSVTSATPSDVTGASFSLTLKKTSNVTVTFAGQIQNNSGARYVLLRFLRDAATLRDANCHVAQSGTGCGVTVVATDFALAAGTYTYKLQLASSNGSDTVLCQSGIIFATAIIA